MLICKLKVSPSPAPSSCSHPKIVIKLKVSPSPSPSSCSHPKFLGRRCTVCGTDDENLRSAASPFRYMCKGLRISPDEANRIRETEFESIKSDCREKNKKSLDLVLASENAVVIVDDTPSVWGKHWTNLITIDKYNYFSESKAQVVNRLCRVMAPMMDEGDADHELSLMLEILKDVHGRFFNDPAMGKDVRKVLEALRQEADQNQMDCSSLMDS